MFRSDITEADATRILADFPKILERFILKIEKSVFEMFSRK
jgi:hypothetical protein